MNKSMELCARTVPDSKLKHHPDPGFKSLDPAKVRGATVKIESLCSKSALVDSRVLILSLTVLAWLSCKDFVAPMIHHGDLLTDTLECCKVKGCHCNGFLLTVALGDHAAPWIHNLEFPGERSSWSIGPDRSCSVSLPYASMFTMACP